MDREYIFTFNLKTEHINKLYLRYGGTWISDKQEVEINLSNSEVNKTGDKIYEASYNENLVTIRFKVSNLDGSASDSYQFLVIAESENAQRAVIDIDNVRFKLIPVLSGIVLNTTDAIKKFDFGASFSYEGLKVIGVNSDGTTIDINPSDCTFTGYDMSLEGRQIITVSYQSFEAIYQIEVNRVLKELIVESNNVKKSYGYGESLDLTGLVVKVAYIDGGEEVTLEHDSLRIYGYAVFAGGFNSRKNGTYTIEIVYRNLKATFDVTVSFEEVYSFGESNY